MLENLLIKNVALIEEIEVNFHKGLNILSGETGAGKSIIIDSIEFVLGGRPGKDFVRSGAEQANVEGLFSLDNPRNVESVKAMGIEPDEDGMLLLSRVYSAQGKSSCRINGRTVTIGMLKDIAALIVDVHGQHEHQSLLNPNRHIELLDTFCGEDLAQQKNELAEKIKSFREIQKAFKAISGNESDRAARLEILQYQIDEIKSVNPIIDEEEKLNERRNILESSEKLSHNLETAITMLYGDESDDIAARDRVQSALRAAREIAELDESQEYLADALETVAASMEEVIRDLRRYYENIEHDPAEIDKIEQRLDALYLLRRKYGGTVKDVLEYYKKITVEMEFIVNSEGELKRLNAEKRHCGGEILSVCEKMTECRKSAATDIRREIEHTLKDLGMKNAKFDILIEKKKEFGTNGNDKIEFLISPNLGEPVKPLAKIASGGEMSRVMLAMKAVLADADTIETFIFDEIDAGVSGRTAQMVAEKLSVLGRRHQILCITHLPQIAAMGDKHFLIEKKSDESKTLTYVSELSYDKVISELSRLIGGAKITEATKKAAEEMKQMAGLIKESK